MHGRLFCHFFYARKTTFVTSFLLLPVCFPVLKPEKWPVVKGKEFAPKFFPF